MLENKDLETITHIYRLQPDRSEPPTVLSLKNAISDINNLVNSYLVETRFEMTIPVFDKSFNISYGLRMARCTSDKHIVGDGALDRIMRLAGVSFDEYQKGEPSFVVEQHVLADNLSDLRFDETVENHQLLNKLLDSYFTSLPFRESNVHKLIEQHINIESYLNIDQRLALVRMYAVCDIALNITNTLLNEIYDEDAEKRRADFVEYKQKKHLAEQKAITDKYIAARADCEVEQLSLGELSEHMTEDEKNDQWIQIHDLPAETASGINDTYDKRKDKHLLTEIEGYLYSIQGNCAGPTYWDKREIITKLKDKLTIPKNTHMLLSWEDQEVERLQRVKQFLRLVHLVSNKASYKFNTIDEVPLCHLHADGSFTDDELMKEIINVALTTGDLLDSDIEHIHKCYSDKTIVVGIRMVAKAEGENPIIKIGANEELDKEGRLPPVVNWRMRLPGDEFKPYVSDFA